MKKKYKIDENGVTKVAVLVSPGFGAGWYSWNNGEKAMLFNPVIVDFITAKTIDHPALLEYLEKQYPGEYFGGLDDLSVEWITKGSKFVVHEYDGSESLQIKDNFDWITA